VLAARRVDHDPGARPRRPAPRGRRERRLLLSLAARHRPVHLARRPARRPRPGDVGDRRACAAQPRPRVRARGAAVARTRGRLARPRAHFREGLATYGEFHNLHHYLGSRVWQTELLRGEQARVVQGLYDSLAHTTNTNGGFETGVRPYARRSVDDNLAPHGWFAAELVALLRNMLVRESSGGLELLSAMPGRWLEPGRPTVVRGAPTKLGSVDLSLR